MTQVSRIVDVSFWYTSFLSSPIQVWNAIDIHKKEEKETGRMSLQEKRCYYYSKTVGYFFVHYAVADLDVMLKVSASLCLCLFSHLDNCTR
jgi:hypothetical protein